MLAFGILILGMLMLNGMWYAASLYGSDWNCGTWHDGTWYFDTEYICWYWVHGVLVCCHLLFRYLVHMLVGGCIEETRRKLEDSLKNGKQCRWGMLLVLPLERPHCGRIVGLWRSWRKHVCSQGALLNCGDQHEAPECIVFIYCFYYYIYGFIYEPVRLRTEVISPK